jgi:hypothetical protein
MKSRMKYRMKGRSLPGPLTWVPISVAKRKSEPQALVFLGPYIHHWTRTGGTEVVCPSWNSNVTLACWV